jgi:hypothetical protein
MKKQNNRDQVLEEYYLIDWTKPPSKQRRDTIIHMTAYEAWVANQGLGLNCTTLRYIKNLTET